MLEAYTLNPTVAAGAACQLENVAIEKGCTTELVSSATITFNKKGVYMLSCDASAAAASTLQLYKNGVPQPQAQATGTNPHFTTLVQVPNDNSCCCSESPTKIQIINPTDAAETFTSVNVCITKIC